MTESFVQFLLIGAVIFFLAHITNDTALKENRQTIHLDESTLDWIYQNFRKQFKRPPTRTEMRALIDAHIMAEVKYREGLALKLDVGDSIVQRRMAQKIDFLYGGMADSIVPEKSVLMQWYQRNLSLFTLAKTISFEHLYFSPDSHGGELEKITNDHFIRLSAQPSPPNIGAAPDPFPYGQAFDSISEFEVTRLFGHKFTEDLFNQPLAVWSGPVQSGYGLHLVRILDMTQGQAPAFETVIEAVTSHWRQEENRRLLAKKLTAMKEKYQISIDPKLFDQFPGLKEARP